MLDVGRAEVAGPDFGSQHFNEGWVFEPGGAAVPVTLPHDAMQHQGRSADAPSGAHAAHFLGGNYRYSKTWFAPAALAGRQLTLVFEGVYQHSHVLVNGVDVGGELNGYVEFEVRIDPFIRFGSDNLIEVTVDNTAQPNARWYTGSGIYRPVWLRINHDIQLRRDGVQVRTLDIDADTGARVEVTVHAANPGRSPLHITATLSDTDQDITRTATTTGEQAVLELTVPRPRLWSADTPHLYRATVTLNVAGSPVDRLVTRVGLRTVTTDRNGLAVNGAPTLLRGANVHHDNGVIGATTLRAAEFRRVRILKENGFNALRSAHNPASRALLDACDELGMYVMDELFDGWYDHKTARDDARQFDRVWRAQLAALVAKDRNHPSVIMYSIGNENTEPVSRHGIDTARTLADTLRALDPQRLVSAGVNLMSAATSWPTTPKATWEPGSAPRMDSTMVNLVSNQFGRLARLAPRLKRTDAVTREMFDALDVAGYNYGSVRYPVDARLHPDRIIVGTESMPGDIARNWALVEQLPTVIGDFMWTGWDYLGEAGIGTWTYGPRMPFLKPYPHLIAGAGAIDITGLPGAPTLLARAAWGQLAAPAITVRPVDLAHRKTRRSAWRSTDAVPSWSWSGQDGRPAHVEVYSTDDEVELTVNGRSMGRRPAGRRAGFLAHFHTRYETGEITAVGYRDGVAVSRTSLRSAQYARLGLVYDRPVLVADGQDAAFIVVQIRDPDGTVEMTADDEVTITLDGPASLAGFGSAAPATVESFVDHTHRTFRGRALAVVRAGSEAGTVTVTAHSARHGSATIDISVGPVARSLYEEAATVEAVPATAASR